MIHQEQQQQHESPVNRLYECKPVKSFSIQDTNGTDAFSLTQLTTKVEVKLCQYKVFSRSFLYRIFHSGLLEDGYGMDSHYV